MSPFAGVAAAKSLHGSYDGVGARELKPFDDRLHTQAAELHHPSMKRPPCLVAAIFTTLDRQYLLTTEAQVSAHTTTNTSRASRADRGSRAETQPLGLDRDVLHRESVRCADLDHKLPPVDDQHIFAE